MGKADAVFCKFTVDSRASPLEGREPMEGWREPGDSTRGGKHCNLDTLPPLISQPLLPAAVQNGTSNRIPLNPSSGASNS